MISRIYVDFNTMNQDPQERVRINTTLHPELVELLRPGASVVLYDEEMEVTATLEVDVDVKRQWWWGVPDWSTQRDLE